MPRVDGSSGAGSFRLSETDVPRASGSDASANRVSAAAGTPRSAGSRRDSAGGIAPNTSRAHATTCPASKSPTATNAMRSGVYQSR